MCYSPIKIVNRSRHFNEYRDQLYLNVPCGRCLECRAQKKTDSYLRALYEYKFCEDNDGVVLFFTLTYSPENLPLVNFVKCDFVQEYDCQDGWIFDDNDNPIRYTSCQTNCKDILVPSHYNSIDDIQEDSHLIPPQLFPYVKVGDLRLFPSFNIKDVQSFIHKYRQHLKRNFSEEFHYSVDFSHNIKYLITMEYGDTTNRPHYHGLLFFRDLFYPGMKADNKRKIIKWLLDSISKKWTKGFVHFGKLPKDLFDGVKMAGVVYDERALMYVTKYITKDLDFHINSKLSEFKNDRNYLYFHSFNGITPENYKQFQNLNHDITLFNLEGSLENVLALSRYSPRCLCSTHFGERMFWYLSQMDKVQQTITIPVRKYKDGKLILDTATYYLPHYLRTKMLYEKASYFKNGIFRFDYDKLSPFGQQVYPFFKDLTIKNLELSIQDLLVPTNIPEQICKKYFFNDGYSFCEYFRKIFYRFTLNTISYFYVNLRYSVCSSSFSWSDDCFVSLSDGTLSFQNGFVEYIDNQADYYRCNSSDDSFVFNPSHFIAGMANEVKSNLDKPNFKALNEICEIYDAYREIKLNGRKLYYQELEENYKKNKRAKRQLGIITNLYNY